jgi:hypothetical protein
MGIVSQGTPVRLTPLRETLRVTVHQQHLLYDLYWYLREDP